MITQQHEYVTTKHRSAAPLTLEIVCGAAAGAALGMVVGPSGMAIGAALGGAVGAAAGVALRDTEIQRERNDARRDRDIGVMGGNIGEALPDPPPSPRDAFYAASMRLGGGASGEPSDAPMQNVDDA